MPRLPAELQHVCARFCLEHSSLVRGAQDGAGTRNGNFVRFYRLLADAAGLEPARADLLGALLGVLVEEVHDWDDLIDTHGVEARLARGIVFDFSLRHERQLAADLGISYQALRRVLSSEDSPEDDALLEAGTRLGANEYRRIRRRGLLTSRREYRSAEALGIDPIEHLLLTDAGLDRIERYFSQERRLLSGDPMTLEEADVMLRRGNCDFDLYSDVAFGVLQAERADGGGLAPLRGFVESYTRLDLLLDHLADVEDDVRVGAYNTALLRDRTRTGNAPETAEDPWAAMVESGTMDELSTIGLKIAEEAELAARAASSAHRALLRRLLAGERQALEILVESGYLIDLEPPWRERVKLLLLKPFPWECLTFDEVFGDDTGPL